MEESVLYWAVGDAYKEQGLAIGEMIRASNPDGFLYLGDVYDSGRIEEFRYYDRAFGALKEITYPIPGNHDYICNLEGYKHYWPEVPPYYAFDAAGWRFYCLDSIQDCGPGSVVYEWMISQADEWSGPVTICFHHHLFSAGGHGDQPQMKAVIDLFSDRVCVGLSGHTHNMQRFKPVGKYTQFVVGCGGQDIYPIQKRDKRLAWCREAHGALRLVYTPKYLKHRFVGLDGKTLEEGWIFVDEPRITLL